jgi:2',3'-cyclic-nucleotide 2'-phosphodiesterase (5'-nucleotidase family)
LDSGNSLIGDLDPAKRTQGASSVALMNAMGYDAMALGAGDLSMGLDAIRQRQAEARFPFLSANAVVSGTKELVATPYITREIGSLRVVIFGLSDQGTAPTPGIQVTDPVAGASKVILETRDWANLVILLSHATRPLDQAIGATVPGIDWILEGSLSPQTLEPMKAGKASIVQADYPSPNHAGRVYGLAKLAFDAAGEPSASEWTSVGLSPDVKDDPDMAKLVDTWRQ